MTSSYELTVDRPRDIAARGRDKQPNGAERSALPFNCS